MQKRNNISLTHSPDKTIISFKFDSLNKNDFIENVNKSKFNKCIIFVILMSMGYLRIN